MINAFYFKDWVTDALVNVDIIDPIEITGPTGAALTHYGSGIISDRLETMVHDTADVSPTITEDNLRLLYTNAGATGAVTLTLDAGFQADAPDLTFEVKVAQNLTIDPDGGSTIHPYGSAAGKYARSSDIGSRITIRRVSSTAWKVINIVGTWTWE